MMSFGFVTPSFWEKGKRMVYEKRNDCCDSFNEIAFQID